MIAFECPSCGKSLRVKDELAGRKVKCPGCQKPVGVPQPAASVSPPPSVPGEERTLPPKAPSPGEERTLPPKDRGQAGKKESISDAGGLTDLGAGKRETTQAFPATEHSAELTDFLAPPQKPDEIGRLGPFRVLKVLGHGGMGVVYKAEDPHLERPVALKAMLPTLAASESARQRFLREAKAAATVVHDHIVPIHQVGEDRGVPFIAMQFLEGEPLDDRLKREGRFPVAEVLRIGRETAEGLAAAHEKGLVHRDIKPANIWLEGKKARVKILDFGLARAAAEQAHLTQSGAIIGTPAFMAPEQAQAKPVDQRCDLFSLGCVLYRMGTGKPPFIGADTITTLMAVVTENPVPPRDLNEGVPQSLSDLVMQLLAKNPDDRPQSAQAVVQALQEIEKQTPDTTVQPGQKTQKVKVAGKTKTEAVRMQTASATKKRLPLPWLVGGGVLGLGLLVVGIVLFWQTPHGTVKIESDDPNIEIVFDKTGPTIKGAGKEPIALRAGEHGIVIKRGDFEFGTDKLIIKKGEMITLKIEMLGGKMQLVQDGKVLAAKEMPLGKTFTNTLGMEFVLVPKGKSWLGGGGGKPGDKAVEIAQDFYLGRYEVTQEEWEKVMGNNPSSFKAVAGVAKEDQKRFPVEYVSWEDAQEFIKLLNDKVKEAGWLYRLPKGAEWEYACRGGPLPKKEDYGFDFYFDKPTNQLLPEQLNFDRVLDRTCKVGSYKPNQLGLYDMHGNVWEWCDDPLSDPKDSKRASHRVCLGGCYGSDSRSCRAANRDANTSSFRNGSLGLRLARVPVGNEPVAIPKPRVVVAVDEAWMKHVAGMFAAKQVEAVAAKLKERNPGFEGKVEHVVAGGAVTELRLLAAHQVHDLSAVRALSGLRALECTGIWGKKGELTDLSPLQGMKLTSLICGNTNVSDLSPLKGMKLTRLICDDNKVSDLSPLAGMPLTYLKVWRTPVSNLSPLIGMPLTHLDVGDTPVSDLSPLKGMPLTWLSCWATRQVSDLSPLKNMKLTKLWLTSAAIFDLSPLEGMPLTELDCNDTKVADLSPLRDMRLTKLLCENTKVSDLSPLKGMPLFEIHCDFKPERDADILRSIKTLESINGKAAKDFWKEVDALPKRTSGQPATFKNSLGMEFVLVPKGKSWLGGGGGKPGTTEVEVKEDFYLGKYEVTQEEWEKVMGNSPNWFSRTGPGKSAVSSISDEELKRFPVESVSWDDAQRFFAELNKRTGQAGWVYRLPTEVEWEYACRGGPMTDKSQIAFDYYFEKPTNQVGKAQANIAEGGKGLERPCKVGSYSPNRLGLFDMHGNVWEWCHDALSGKAGRAHRGGDFGRGADACRATDRSLYGQGSAGNNGGFRVARVPVGKESK